MNLLNERTVSSVVCPCNGINLDGFGDFPIFMVLLLSESFTEAFIGEAELEPDVNWTLSEESVAREFVMDFVGSLLVSSALVVSVIMVVS